LPNRFVRLSNPTQGQASDYLFGFDVATAGTVGSIRFQFCANTPLIGDACTAPTGFDVSGATQGFQTGQTGFTISGLTDANTLILTRPPAVAGTGSATYTMLNVQNPTSTGTYFVRVETFATTDATGPDTDYGGLAYVMNGSVSIDATVPPFLLFCTGVTITAFDCSTASGDYVNLGTLTSTDSKAGQTQMLIATNAGNGYGVTVNGTTMTSGTDVIPAIATQDVSRPGTSQFGINLVNNSAPNIGANPSGPGSAAVTNNYNDADRFRFVNGDQLVSSFTSDNYRLFTVSYMANVSAVQEPGTYVSTLTYICTASF
jgi:hypothetical protein